MSGQNTFLCSVLPAHVRQKKNARSNLSPFLYLDASFSLFGVLQFRVLPIVNPLEVLHVREHDLDCPRDPRLLLDGAVHFGGRADPLRAVAQHVDLLLHGGKNLARLGRVERGGVAHPAQAGERRLQLLDLGLDVALGGVSLPLLELQAVGQGQFVRLEGKRQGGELVLKEETRNME